MTATVTRLRAKPKRTRRKTYGRPFTVSHFKEYSSRLVFDDGECRDPEGWQLDYVSDLFRAIDRKSVV